MRHARTKTPIGKPSRTTGGSGLKDLDLESANGYHETGDLNEEATPDTSLVRHPNRNTEKGMEDQGNRDKYDDQEAP